MIVALALTLAVLLEAARRQRNEALIMGYRYRLFSLRDELRERAMAKPEMAKKWVFQYFDSTIAKSIRLLPELSIWSVLALVVSHRDDPTLAAFRGSLQREYSKQGGETYKEFEEKMCLTLAEFIVSRHVVLVVLSSGALLLPVTVAATLRTLKRRSLEVVLESPETSTLPELAPSR